MRPVPVSARADISHVPSFHHVFSPQGALLVSDEPPPARAFPETEPPGDLVYSLRTTFLTSKLGVSVLIFVPLTLGSQHLGLSDGVTFALALAALCPLAERLNFLTEQCSLQTSAVVAAILNVTLGNVTELIVSLFALRAGLLRVLQLSLLGAPTSRLILFSDAEAAFCFPHAHHGPGGVRSNAPLRHLALSPLRGAGSVLSNCLLVMGFSFLAGGLKHKEQSFDRAEANTNVNVILLAAVAHAAPAALVYSKTDRGEGSIVATGRAVSLICVRGPPTHR